MPLPARPAAEGNRSSCSTASKLKCSVREPEDNHYRESLRVIARVHISTPVSRMKRTSSLSIGMPSVSCWRCFRDPDGLRQHAVMPGILRTGNTTLTLAGVTNSDRALALTLSNSANTSAVKEKPEHGVGIQRHRDV